MQKANLYQSCEGLSVETPVQVYNRPGLQSVGYRIGNYHQFRESLLAKLSTAQLAALRQLTTRDESDFTLALLDAWAIVCEVLTFYQERIINESFLGTATELRSVLELARLIGYELGPGVAASTYVAFTLDEASLTANQAVVSGHLLGKPASPLISIDKGIKIQSIPEAGEMPQTFETIEPIEANAGWNAITLRLSQEHKNITKRSILVVQGLNNNLNTGDVLLFVSDQEKIVKKVKKVKINPSENTTNVYLIDPAEASFQLFDTPDTSGTLKSLDDVFPKDASIQNIISQLKQNVISAEEFSVWLKEKEWSLTAINQALNNLSTENLSDVELFVFRQKAAVFGHNATKKITYKTINKGESTESSVPEPINAWAEWKFVGDPNRIYLDIAYDKIVPGSFIMVQLKDQELDNGATYKVQKANTRPYSAYGLNSKVTEIYISPPNQVQWWKGSFRLERKGVDVILNFPEGTVPNLDRNSAREETELSVIRSIVVHVQSESLTLAATPIVEIVEGNKLMLSQLYTGLDKGRTIAISGERADIKGTYAEEIRVIHKAYIVHGYTLLELDSELSHKYIRETVRINANVVKATHGETTSEVLGSGNASKTFQKFVLKQPPLTFISAATTSGTASTLAIRVNDILWKEVNSLYQRGANDHIYIMRQNNSGQTTVIFGDGINGARLPTGVQNIRATYRKGIGVNGLLKAHQLSQLLTRPLGLKAVTNPLSTSGAQDREILADARTNASLTIFTLDRIVSLQDYEDFASAFAGIEKAAATSVWINNKKHIHITIAGYKGEKIGIESLLYKSLQGAMQDKGIPNVPVILTSYRDKLFTLKARIKVHPDYIFHQVQTAVKATLIAQFSFDNRQFSQSVSLSEVTAIIQQIPGVDFVDVDAFHRFTYIGKRLIEDVIGAQKARPKQQDHSGAQLLTIHTGSLQITTL